MAEEKKSASKKSSFSSAWIMAEIGMFLLYVLLPALITGSLLLWLAAVLNFWKIDRTIAIVGFAILYIFLSAVLSVFVSRFLKKKYYRIRIIIMMIGGLFIPILIFGGANVLTITPGETYMNRLIKLSISLPLDVSMDQLGSTIINSHDPYTKVEGIKAINAIHSPAGLVQLFLVLNNDSSALTNWQVADALSTAIASYGIDAKPDLLAAFQKHTKAGQSVPNGMTTSLYDRYFAQSMEGIQSEINAQSLSNESKQDQLQQVSVLATQVKSSLNDIQFKSYQSGAGDPVLDFIADTFLRMNITSDGDLYSFARTTASNSDLPDSVRRKALLLLAKLGGKEDMPLLYQYLNSNSEVIKASAFDAIAGLTLKLNGPAKTK